MKILVAIKQVPDPTVVAFDEQGTLQPNTGLIVNDYDSYAIEAAVRLKEADPDTTDVVAMSLGPASAKDAIARALAMGADRGVHLLTDGTVPDSLAVARAIRTEADAGEYDLVLVGQESSDGGTGNVGPETAALLDWPLISNVVALELEGHKLTLGREVEDGRHVVEVTLPAVLCVLTGLNEPRYPSLKGIMGARKKPLAVTESATDTRAVSWNPPHPEDRPEIGVVVDAEEIGVDAAAHLIVTLLRERDLLP